MRFSNEFVVPLPPAQAWTTLMDIPAIAPCMPGAELTEKVDDATYKGKVSVKLGPVALTFAGVAKFEDIDEAGHAATVKAQGKDLKGRGGGAASVHFHLEPIVGGSKVLIDTDLTLSGAVAQYGRGSGLIQSVAGQIIGQFAETLKKQIDADISVTESNVTPSPAEIWLKQAGGGAKVTPLSPSGPALVLAKPISGFSLVFRAVWASFLGLFHKS